MTAVFDAWRMGQAAWDVSCASAGPLQGIAQRQKARLTALLEAGVRGSRLVRAQLHGRSAADVRLADLPVMHKRHLMAHFDDWVCDSALHLSELRAFTADPEQIARPYLGRYAVWESSGTSGEPAVFVQDAHAMAIYDALESLRHDATPPLQAWLNPLQLVQRTAFVGATSGHFASVVSIQRLRQLNPWLADTLQCFSIDQCLDSLVEELNRFAPSVIATYPTAANMLAGEASRGALQVGLREVWTGGETLGPAVRKRIEDGFDCRVRNSYGASEFLTMGWECGHGNMHANADWVILEPVDDRHRPVPAGEPSCSTLLTNLANHVQPLIRYDLGDQITVAPHPCECGSPLPVIEVQGRNDDALVMAGPGGMAVTLLPLALSTVMEDEAGVFDFQLHQRDGHTLSLRLGPCDGDADATVARCRSALKGFAARQGVQRLRLVHERGVPFARGRSGKLQRIVALASA